MIPKLLTPRRSLVVLSTAAFAFFLNVADAAAAELTTGSLQRSLGYLTYLMLLPFFYVLMRSRRRRHGTSILWAGRHRALAHSRHRVRSGG